MSRYDLFDNHHCHFSHSFDNDDYRNDVNDDDISYDDNDDDKSFHREYDYNQCHVNENENVNVNENDCYGNVVPQLIHYLRSSNWSLALQRLSTHPHEAQWIGRYDNETPLHAAFTSTNDDDDYGDDNDHGNEYDHGNAYGHAYGHDYDDYTTATNNATRTNNSSRREQLQFNIHVPMAIIRSIVNINMNAGVCESENGNQNDNQNNGNGNGNAKGMKILNMRMDNDTTGTSILDLIILSWCDVIKVINGPPCACTDNFAHDDDHDYDNDHDNNHHTCAYHTGSSNCNIKCHSRYTSTSCSYLCSRSCRSSCRCIVQSEDLDMLPPAYEYELRKQVIQYITSSLQNSLTLSSSNSLTSTLSSTSLSTSTTMEYIWNWIFHSNRFLSNYPDLDSVMQYLDNHNNHKNCDNDNNGKKKKMKKMKISTQTPNNKDNGSNSRGDVHKVVSYVQFFISILDIMLSHVDHLHGNGHQQYCTINNSPLSSSVSALASSSASLPRTKTLPTTNTTATTNTTTNFLLLHVLLQMYNTKKSSSVPILILKLAIKTATSIGTTRSTTKSTLPSKNSNDADSKKIKKTKETNSCQIKDDKGRTPLIIAITSNETHWENNTNPQNSNDDDNNIRHIDEEIHEEAISTSVSATTRNITSFQSNKVTIIKTILDQSPGCASIPHGITLRLPLHLALDHEIDRSIGTLYNERNGNDHGNSNSNSNSNDRTEVDSKVCKKKRLTWNSGIALLVYDSPHLLHEKDVKTGLHAFALAGAAIDAGSTSKSTIESITHDEKDASGMQSENGRKNKHDTFICLDTIYQLLLFDPMVLSKENRSV